MKWALNRISPAMVPKNQQTFKSWQLVNIAQAGIYAYRQKKMNAKTALEPLMLQSFYGHCDAFDNKYGVFAPVGLTGEVLKLKVLTNRAKSADSFNGDDIHRRYKDLKKYNTNEFLPALNEVCNKKKVPIKQRIPSGKQMADILEEVVQRLWNASEAERINRKKKYDATKSSKKAAKVCTPNLYFYCAWQTYFHFFSSNKLIF
jgi:hypothetical protein